MGQAPTTPSLTASYCASQSRDLQGSRRTAAVRRVRISGCVTTGRHGACASGTSWAAAAMPPAQEPTGSHPARGVPNKRAEEVCVSAQNRSKKRPAS